MGVRKTVHFTDKVDSDLLDWIDEYDNFSALAKKALRNEMKRDVKRDKPKKSKQPKAKEIPKAQTEQAEAPIIKPFINPNIKRN